MRAFGGLALIVSLACGGARQPHLEFAPDHAALASVRTIYLGDFGSTEGADLVREKIRLRLLNSQRFAVVETSEKADAVLAGSVGIDRSTTNGTTDYAGIGLLRLVDQRTQKTIWAHEYTRGYMLSGSVSTRVANQMVDQLLADAKQ